MTMQAYRLEDLIERRAGSGRPYLEFQRSVDLSSGLYVLPAGGTDHHAGGALPSRRAAMSCVSMTCTRSSAQSWKPMW